MMSFRDTYSSQPAYLYGPPRFLAPPSSQSSGQSQSTVRPHQYDAEAEFEDEAGAEAEADEAFGNGYGPFHSHADSFFSAPPLQPPPSSQSLSPSPFSSLASSSPSTVIQFAPTPPAPAQPSTSHHLYGRFDPDLLFGPPLVPLYHAAMSYPAPPPPVRFHNPNMSVVAAIRAGMIRDEIANAAGHVTPGIDHTPIIRHALDVLTRQYGTPFSASSTTATDEDRPVEIPPSPHEFDIFATLPPLPPPFVQSYFPVSNEHITYRPTAPAVGRPGAVGRPTLSLPPAPYYLTPSLPPLSPLADSPSGQPEDATDSSHYSESSRISTPDASLGDEALSSLVKPKVDEKIVPTLLAERPFMKDFWVPVRDSELDVWDPERETIPRLNYKPRMLQTVYMMMLMILCVLMIAALMFSAIYASRHTKLMIYSGSIYSGQYFLFRILPQLLAAFILLLAQHTILTSFRLDPFARMAQHTPATRLGALFQTMYPKSFFWPHLVGPWQQKVAIFATWLLNFTIPLQSTIFTVILVDDKWFWITVQPSAWILIALYIIYITALIILISHWHGRTTGVHWDVRCLADMISMFHMSDVNTIKSYVGTDCLTKRRDIRSELRERCADRLGYWRTDDPQSMVSWSISAPTELKNLSQTRGRRILGRRFSSRPPVESFVLDARPDLPDVRWRYLPWCMRNNQIIYYIVTGATLLVALLVVSFRESTRLSNGFHPALSAQPGPGAFSPANFLYSFLPALLGHVAFLLFQSLDLSLRSLQPWGELARPEGSRPDKSLLVDYAACAPFQSAFRAASNHHWRVAFVSLLAALFVFIPILGGGLFMALTVSSTGEVLMFPNLNVFAVLITLLCLYLLGLVALVPGRFRLRLPHPVECPAEIFSFCAAHELIRDPAFRFTPTRREMLRRLGIGLDKWNRGRWVLAPPKNDARGQLSVRRVQKYTQRPVGSIV